MFISRPVYDDLVAERQKAILRSEHLQHRELQLQAQLDWLQVQYTRLSYENAQMLDRYLGIKVPVPSFDKERTEPLDPNQTLDFNDVGDERAAQMGLGWAKDGSLVSLTK